MGKALVFSVRRLLRIQMRSNLVAISRARSEVNVTNSEIVSKRSYRSGRLMILKLCSPAPRAQDVKAISAAVSCVIVERGISRYRDARAFRNFARAHRDDAAQLQPGYALSRHPDALDADERSDSNYNRELSKWATLEVEG